MSRAAPLDLQIVDFGGHPFTAELANTLHNEGAKVEYVYCSSNDTAPHGDIERLSSGGLAVTAIDLGRPFEKHSALRRLRDELGFGVRLAARCSAKTVVACQLPVLSAWVVMLVCALRRKRFVLWLQDFQADLAGLSSGGTVVRLLSVTENFLIRGSSHVIAISDRFADRCHSLGRRRSVSVLPNWAPLERLPEVDRVNTWSAEHDLRPDRFRVIYSGTMGTKHRATDLLEVARRLGDIGGIDLVFVTVGAGIDSIRDELKDLGHVSVLPLQPHDRLAEVLGSADALLVTLDSAANEACVPSKVLSYLCAARPIVGMLDAQNPSAQLITRAEVGIIADDPESVVNGLQLLHQDPESAKANGKHGRAFAEEHFAKNTVAESFLAAAKVSR